MAQMRPGYLCEQCLDAPAVVFVAAPWGGEMGVCETCGGLLPAVPAGMVAVAESGIHSVADLARMVAAGAQAVLIGEAFMAHPDPGEALAGLLAAWRRCR